MREDGPPVEHGPAGLDGGDVGEVGGQRVVVPYVRGRRLGHRGAALPPGGWFHSERVRPAGFRDEVTWALRHRAVTSA
ncbi:hypothetical protein N4G69_42670 [Streptomyces mirabilis]|uniref:hypothetical protein n=1 Tax=Streptomyces mirabilis TaxID=68239 RepID=UPI0021BEF43E|nr:hypothetical protein [Streptomyces mirabilis]MCT9112215.1 hypothetical protein [Streptomyces mirabilis]